MKKMKTVNCPDCGKTVKRLELHQKISHPQVEEELEEVYEEEPEDTEPVDETVVTLNFRESVEIYVNGTPYIGKTVKVIGMQVASDVVRIAKEAYGWDILI